MILKLTDRTEIQLTDKEAAAVERLIEQGKEFIKIGSTMIKRNQIAQIVPGNITKINPFSNVRALQRPQCHAQFSIQREIIMSIRRRMGHDWAKGLRDKKLKAEIYKELRSQKGIKWCDYKTGECYCSDPEKAAEQNRASIEAFRSGVGNN